MDEDIELRTARDESIELRAARSADAEPLARLNIAAWLGAYQEILPASYLQALSVDVQTSQLLTHILWPSNDRRLVVASQAGVICGFYLLGACVDATTTSDGELYAIYVHPDYWRRGVGTMLLQHALAAAEGRGYLSLSLWALTENKVARAFYERHGFQLLSDQERVLSNNLGGISKARYRLLLVHD